jgi:2-polyprenyl-3-methyl-5-hydroxy-6-metoxy-1,4-benzoquinol methylase
LQIIDEYRPKRILEIGAGSGYLGRRLKDKGIWISGIDLVGSGYRDYGEFFCENIDQFDWDRLSGHFDLVCLMDVLEHLKEPEKLLLQLRNNPKLEGAVFVVSVPNVAFFR